MLQAHSAVKATHTIAICGNPNSGKTTIFNAITGLSQKVGNYPGVTVDKVSGMFSLGKDDPRRFELVDIPGTYSLAAFSPDEYIAVAALCGSVKDVPEPDALICVVDATNLERGLYFVLQTLQIGRPVVMALNMIDLARKRGLKIDFEKLSAELGGMPVVPVIGTKSEGIAELKKVAVELTEKGRHKPDRCFDETTEGVLDELDSIGHHSSPNRAELIRVLFDEGGPAEKHFLDDVKAADGDNAVALDRLRAGRLRIKEKYGALHVAESQKLTGQASAIYHAAVTSLAVRRKTRSELLDKFLLNPFFGPIFLLIMMSLVFQSIFTWAEPFMDLIDSGFGILAGLVENHMADGPLRSLLTDGVIGGVGSVLVFLPQIIILFLFIALLEDSGYMSRAAFLVDRMFRWCGLSGKSFIPMLSSFACSVPGIMATRTIEDRKLRFITIMVAPLMPCSARLPVYAIMIAAFVPARTYLGIIKLQGLVLTALYMLGIVVAVLVSFIMQKVLFKAERGTFIMEMPSYKLPTFRSVFIRVVNRSKSFVARAGTVIFAITILIWALSYYPRPKEQLAEFAEKEAVVNEDMMAEQTNMEERVYGLTAGLSDPAREQLQMLSEQVQSAENIDELNTMSREATPDLDPAVVDLVVQQRRSLLEHQARLTRLSNEQSGELLRNSYFGRIGRTVEPAFRPLGWDWRITMAVLASFPAREVIIATLGTIYNLGTDVDEESVTLVDKMRQATWEEGEWRGARVFTVPVALSIMVFFALCCQCGATVVTVRQETRSWMYAAGLFLYMTVLAYVLAFCTFQIASLLRL
ncbi:MAG TPA: ferrous iron transport protein B [candidate division Zixibacteria bacterium]|nr:ferrous iron transport protein B [candidate division Zixibacteria bacterium]